MTIILGLGCGGSSHPPSPDAKDGPKESATGNAGTTGAAGNDAGSDVKEGGAGTTGAAGNDAGSDVKEGGAGTTGAAGNDGGPDSTGAAGSDAGSDVKEGGTDSTGAAGNDGGPDSTGAAGSDAAAGSDGGATDAADGGSDASDVACTNACTLNAKQCGGGGIQTCVTGSNGCTVWGAAANCGAHQSCTGAVGAAACTCNVDPTCATGTDKACDSNGALITCALDADNCPFVMTTAACPTHQTCTGTKPNASCECVNPPTECMGAAGTTFCSTSTAVRTCKTDTSNAKNCIFADTAVACGPHQACTTPTAGAAACSCVADTNCTAGNSPGDLCSGSSSIHCAKDANNCPFTETTTACNAHSTCDAGTGLCKCNASICTVAGPTCDTGNVSTCAQDGACFFVSGTAATCTANETCQGANGAAACSCKAPPAICTNGAGTYCSNNAVTSCVPDAHGCVTVPGQPVACNAHQTCSGNAGAGACACNPAPAGCTGLGSFCTNGTTQSACKLDGACPYSDAADNTTCPANQSCKGAGLGGACSCDDTCSAAQAGNGAGTYCVDAMHVNTCTNDPNSCHIAGTPTLCVGTRTCQGSDGTAACLCPVAGVTAGTGCTTPGDTICQGDIVLTCTTENLGGCNIWAAPNDCALQSLVCGTKKGANKADCQCPEHTGNDYFVDSLNGTDSPSGSFPTGVQNPSFCRFGSLGKALSLATSGQRVVATAEAGVTSMTFNSEAFPLGVGAGVTLTTSGGVAPAGKWVINFNSAGGAAVSLGTGSTLENFEIDTDVGGTASASLVSAPGAGATIANVVLDGGGVQAGGISVSGGGQAVITGATLTGFTTGLRVASSSGVATSLSSSSITGGGTGIAISNGTLTGSTTNVSGNSGVGVSLSAAPAAISTLNSSMAVFNNGAGGIVQSATGGTTTLNLTGGDIHHNTGGGVTVSAAGGMASIGAAQIHDNFGSGVTQSAGTLSISGATISANMTTGVAVSAGTLTIGNTTVSGNTSDGLQVAGGTVTVNTGAKFDGNTGTGIRSLGTVTLNGSAGAPITASNNVGDGVSIGAGNLTASYLTADGNGTGATKSSGLKASGTAVINLGTANDAAISFSSNGLNGINVAATAAGSTISVVRTTVKSNGGDGVFVDLNGGTAGSAASFSMSSSNVSSNTGNGITIARAPQGLSVTKAVFDLMTIGNNGAAGVFYRGTNGTTAGSAAATVTNSKIQNNTGAGVRIEQTLTNTTIEGLQGNDINTNGGGGVVFNTASTVSSFQGNLVHNNTGDQITISGPQNSGSAYPFRSVTNTCDANRNQIYCYQIGSVGIRVNSVLPTSVDAEKVTWKAAAPISGTDYAVTGLNTVDATLPCTNVSSCP